LFNFTSRVSFFVNEWAHYSEVRTAENLRQLLLTWVREYEAHLNSDNHLRYFVYTPGSQATEDYYDATSNYSEFRFESGKTFNNIFFPEKENILKRINFFANNKAGGGLYMLGVLIESLPTERPSDISTRTLCPPNFFPTKYFLPWDNSPPLCNVLGFYISPQLIRDVYTFFT
jgi:hypothetical protein